MKKISPASVVQIVILLLAIFFFLKYCDNYKEEVSKKPETRENFKRGDLAVLGENKIYIALSPTCFKNAIGEILPFSKLAYPNIVIVSKNDPKYCEFLEKFALGENAKDKK